MAETISLEKQAKVIQFVEENFKMFKEMTEQWRKEQIEVYREYITFKQRKQAEWETEFKVNKAHEVVNKLLPRIMSKNPKWIVSTRTDVFKDEDNMLEGLDKAQRSAEMAKMAEAVQDYLHYIFDQYGISEPLRLWAKNMLIYGNSYAKVIFKYEQARVRESDGTITEKIIGEYPTIEPKSRTEMYFDPRYILLQDMPGIIEYQNGVRLADLKRKKQYFNLDKVAELPDKETFAEDQEQGKRQIFTITGINQELRKEGVDKNALSIKTYYGFYEQDGEEKMYEITTVEDLILIGMKEITQIPLEDVKCFEDTETHFSYGFVKPIISLQRELNFKKNSASTYINHGLNRSWIWSPNSGVNPRDLISKPNNIIATNKSVEAALQNLQELPHRELPASYFQEENDFERQIQAMTFTVDTSNPQSQQALTNTATGARIKFFESNSVIDGIRKQFEEGMVKLAYKLLDATYENMENNIVIKKMGTEEFFEINKELLRDALNRYEIKIEANSSSFDSLENRREDAIAFWNVLSQAKQSGMPVNDIEALKEVISTFERKSPDRFIQEQPQQFGEAPQQTQQINPDQLPQQAPTGAAEITEQVAQGGLTAGQ